MCPYPGGAAKVDQSRKFNRIAEGSVTNSEDLCHQLPDFLMCHLDAPNFIGVEVAVVREKVTQTSVSSNDIPFASNAPE